MATDGASAVIEVPFPPLAPPPVAQPSLGQRLPAQPPLGQPPSAPPPLAQPTLAQPPSGHDDLAALVQHVLLDRPVGAVLVRKGGYAVGNFWGRTLVSSKVGSAYVQGRTKAGGWSQQRYARRRANQTEQAYAEAADVVAKLLLPLTAELEAVVGGGDTVGVQAVLADRRLSPLLRLLQPRVMPTVDPRLRVLQAFGDQLRSVRITLNALA